CRHHGGYVPVGPLVGGGGPLGAVGGGGGIGGGGGRHTGGGPGGGLLAGLALLVEGEDLQLDGEIDLAHVDAVRDGQHGRREVEDGGDPGGHQPVADLLCGARGGRDH